MDNWFEIFLNTDLYHTRKYQLTSVNYWNCLTNRYQKKRYTFKVRNRLDRCDSQLIVEILLKTLRIFRRIFNVILMFFTIWTWTSPWCRFFGFLSWNRTKWKNKKVNRPVRFSSNVWRWFKKRTCVMGARLSIFYLETVLSTHIFSNL